MAVSGLFAIPGTNTSIEFVYQLPKVSIPRGLVLLAHGCRQSPRVWFGESTTCIACIPRPEERCLAARLIESRYALLAVGNLKGSKACWETNDVPIVSALLKSWRRQHEHRVPKRAPLFLLGPSSGGFFAAHAARTWPEIRGLSIQVSVPSVEDIDAAVRTHGAFPPTQLVLMPKDSGKLKEAERLRASFRPPDALEVVVTSPLAVHPLFFSDGIPGLAPSLSAAVRQRLIAAGHIDGRTSIILKHPSRGAWRDPVRQALESGAGTSATRRAGLPQGSLQLTMDAIFARLDLAYAYHASTCEVANQTLAFFARADGAGAHRERRR